MIRFDERTGYMFATDLGRTASHFYIKYDTVEVCLLKLSLQRIHITCNVFTLRARESKT